MKLDKYQDKAVITEEDKVVVIACAGSGKTRVLTERIRYLIEEKHEPPANIVAITLTNQAADEIITRLSDVNGIQNMFIGTIHSMAYNILRTLGFNFRILSDELDYEIHMELIKKHAKFLTEKEYTKYRTSLLSYKLGLIQEGELLRNISRESLSELNALEGNPTQEYPVTMKTICESRNIIQFDDLLRLVINSGINVNINHLLVDEFQDIGSLEYKFITSLNSKNIFVVGDDWQSIYSFRGSNLDIFKSLYNDPDYTKFLLSNNYRSDTNIVDLSNTIIECSRHKINKPVFCNSKDSGNITYIRDDKLFNKLEEIRDEGDYRSWFILARSNKDVVYLSNLLQNFNVPYSIFRREGMSGNDIKALMYNNTVKLMTIHASKGLESDNVLVYGDYTSNLKNTCYRLKDEEIRVYYVAVTRARKNLVIVSKSSFNNKLNVDNVKLNITGAHFINNSNFNAVKEKICKELDNKCDAASFYDPDLDDTRSLPSFEELEKLEGEMYS